MNWRFCSPAQSLGYEDKGSVLHDDEERVDKSR